MKIGTIRYFGKKKFTVEATGGDSKNSYTLYRGEKVYSINRRGDTTLILEIESHGKSIFFVGEDISRLIKFLSQSV